MIDFMTHQYDLTRHQAFGLASVLVDLRITQIVNKVRGVHAVLSHEAIVEAGLREIEGFNLR
jgi:acetamidase/formamidase